MMEHARREGTNAARIGGDPGRLHSAVLPVAQRERLPLAFLTTLAFLPDIADAAFLLRSA